MSFPCSTAPARLARLSMGTAFQFLVVFSALLPPLAFGANCSDGSIPMYISGRGEVCPDGLPPQGRAAAPAVPALPPPAPSPSPAAGSSANEPTPGPAASGHVRLVGRCRGVSCRVQEGWQPGLTTVELEGHLPQYEGRSLELVVGNAASRRQVVRRKFGVLANGDFTASIPAYQLAAGDYVFGLVPVGTKQLVAMGGFAIGGAKPGSAAPQRPAGGSSVVGTWYGVGGTMGKIELHPDGTYTSNGEPAGRYQVSGDQIVFTGNLAAWNGGRATLKPGGTMEFYWKNANGAVNYFAFGKY